MINDIILKVDVFECDTRGNAVVVSKSREDLTRLKSETELPIRDFRIFFHRQQGALKDCSFDITIDISDRVTI